MYTTPVVTKYQKRISGPLLDRIDIHIEAPRVDYEKLSGDQVGESSDSIRARVQAARDIQVNGFPRTAQQILSITPICAWGRYGSFASYKQKVKA